MFVGHYALGFAAKKLAPEVSLGTLFLACQLADLLWPTFVLFGLESFEIAPGATAVTPLAFTHYPYSHSLVALAGWGVALAAIYWAARRGRPLTLLVLTLLVVSHWVLDVVSHRPDMPLAPGGIERFGFELWQSVPLTLAVEFLLFGIGVWLYASVTQARDRIGTWALRSLVAFLAVIELANIFGPPPPSTMAVTWSAQGLWLVVAWGYWVERHRVYRG